MNDLISRQDAIDAMVKLYEDDVEMYGCAIPECFDSARAIDELLNLPSTQPSDEYKMGWDDGREALIEEMRENGKDTDLISRQAVLDYIDSMPSELTNDGRRMIRRIRLTEYISDTLPSTESEQKRGRMTPEAFKNEMQKISNRQGEKYIDAEITHTEADELMCELLRELGYGEGIDVFEDMPKWYA